jgi:hypothetical protein
MILLKIINFNHMKNFLQIVLIIVALGLAYLIYKSIQDPIDFEKAREQRYAATIQRLKDIRKAQLAYKDVYGKFTGSWDTLIDFVKNDSVRKKGAETWTDNSRYH